MNKMGEQEFAAFLKTQSFGEENSNNKKSIDAFYCLTALIVTNYSESDLARYFLPKELTKEIKPERLNSNWSVIYWLQLLGYWATKLFSREKYQYTAATTETKKVSNALASVRESMGSDKTYLQLRTEKAFIDDLHLIMENAVKSISLNNDDALLVNLATPLTPDVLVNNTVDNLLDLSTIVQIPPVEPEPKIVEKTVEDVKKNYDSDAKTVLTTTSKTTDAPGQIPPPPNFDAALFDKIKIHREPEQNEEKKTTVENANVLNNTLDDEKETPADSRANLLSQIQQFSFKKQKICINQVPELLTEVQKEVEQKNTTTMPLSDIGDILRAVVAQRCPVMSYSDDENSGDESGDENDNDWNGNDVTDDTDSSSRIETDCVSKSNHLLEEPSVTPNELEMACNTVVQSLFNDDEEKNNISSKKLAKIIRQTILMQRTAAAFQAQQLDVETTSTAASTAGLFKPECSSNNNIGVDSVENVQGQPKNPSI